MRHLLILLLALLPAPALAWGDYAHRLTARIAWAQLTPDARAEVRQLLRAEPDLATQDCPLSTIEDASVWPDCVRARHAKRFAFSAPWHYQNISVCQAFDITARCENGDCVTAQIPRQQAILADRTRPAVERLQALSFLVHFIGDMHQPLHLGDKSDLGGNQVRAAYGVKAPEGMNLHRVWDSDLAERALTEPPAISPAAITPAQRRDFTAGPADTAARVALWAREAWDISRRVAYPELADVPDSCPLPADARAGSPRGLVTPAYIATATPAVRDQVAKAGTRIALLVNAALAGKRTQR
ncbi:S1/P1 nuclease [Sandarakinorhabdus rubra]|uniref:S1/P1 nuclease n=1 Tax=Sandarakinorhabdus rubra TaxID=2672568 RepID=UPI0013D98CAF|nr:S1/P1 nuclease [Sandarakinorhabdus rubra]